MVEKEIAGLKDYDGEDQVLPFHVLREKYRKKRENLIFATHFPSLDRYMGGGLMLGELIIMTGETKSGKTLAMQSITQNLELQGANPLWFQFEVPPRQFFDSFLHLPTGFMSADQKPYSLDWIEKRIVEGYEKYNCRVIFIDHLHFLFDIARKKNPSLEIGSLIRKLKTIAVQREMVIFLACHATKGGKDRTAKNIDYHAIRDSSLIAQESDSVLIISRIGDGNEAQLKLEFHRRTGERKKVIDLIKVKGKLHEKMFENG